jgi:hypothetical protein
MARITVDWKRRTTAAEREAQASALRARRYLADTDWMVVRAAEPGGKPVPGDVLAARAAARTKISGE